MINHSSLQATKAFPIIGKAQNSKDQIWGATTEFIPDIMLITIGHQKTPESLFTTLGLIQLT